MITRLASIAGALALIMTVPALAQQGAVPAQQGAGTGAGQAIQVSPESAPGALGGGQQAGAHERGERGERGGRGRLAACRGDVQALCKGVEAGRGRKMACLSENMEKLSPDCAAIVQARAEGKGERSGRGQTGARSALGAGPAGGAVDSAQARGAAQGQGAIAQAPSGVPGAAAGGRAGGAAGSTVNEAAPQAGVPQGGVPSAGAPAADTAPPAKGQGGKGGRQTMAACRIDMATFCQTAEKGGGRMRCLRENQAKLSPECQAVLGERAQAAGNFREACKADQAALCAGVERGGGKLMQCLRENQAKLSPACGEAITAMPERGGKGRGKRAEGAPRLQ